MDTTYSHKGIPLTAAVAQALIRKLFSGRLVERQVIVDEVLRTHIAGGGLKPVAQDSSKIFEKALGDMRRVGEAENMSRGYWRIQQSLSVESDSPAEEIPDSPAVQSDQTSPVTEPAADFELGAGPAAVYVYYLPTYRLRAQERGEKSWPCKVGRTDRDPLSRVLSQAATALPERPAIAVILRTTNPSAWEKALHGALSIRGLRIEDSPGVEWFLTSPEEIVALIKVIDPSIQNIASTNNGNARA